VLTGEAANKNMLLTLYYSNQFLVDSNNW